MPQHPCPYWLLDVPFSEEYNFFYVGTKDGVIAIHCNHGKGRTGTGIISFMVLVGYIHSSEVCLKLYNSKRFSSTNYGVDQPCQKRYLKYLERIARGVKIDPKLVFYRLKRVEGSGALNEKYFIQVTQNRS